MYKWISCKHEMPPPGKMVKVFTGFFSFEYAYCFGSSGIYDWFYKSGLRFKSLKPSDKWKPIEQGYGQIPKTN